MREIFEFIEDVANDQMSASDAADEILELKLGDIIDAPTKLVQKIKKAGKGVKKALKGPEQKLGGKLKLGQMRQWQDPGEVSKYGTRVRFKGKKVYGTA